MLGPERFRFLNRTHDLAGAAWDDPALPKLWRYNLHYFDDLNAQDADVRAVWHRALMERWVRDNAPGVGTGWEPYPTSLRIVNWVKWALAGNVLPSACVQSLAVQARWLSKRIEVHLLGNHLFSNAKALVFAGLYFNGPEAAAWLDKGMGILSRELPEQVLSDGGHFELSTMYHALALEDLLDLSNLASAFSREIPMRWQATIASWTCAIDPMRRWLAAMSHPDAMIAFFNDAAFGVAPTVLELERYASRLGFRPLAPESRELTHLAASGYVRVDAQESAAILDVARIGPDYLPAHAHADTLSFEMSLFGQRVIVNSGISEYGSGRERVRQRGTRAHNTVTIDARDSSEVWGGFRVARRAHPVGLEIERGEVVTIRCAHDGYQRLNARVQHLRQWSFAGRSLTVDDSITGTFGCAEARFHLHPSVRVDVAGSDTTAGRVTLVLPQGKKLHISVEGGQLTMEQSTWHPEFGVTQSNLCVAVQFAGPVLSTRFNWECPG